MINALIVGGQQGIGRALVEQLLSSGEHRVIATSRQHGKDLDPSTEVMQARLDITDENSIANLTEALADQFEHIDWLINCAGVLYTEQFQPEKTYKHWQADRFAQSFSINCSGHLLLIKALAPLLLKSTQPMVASISAWIGSIADNQLGGWHAYRMSKAALNQGVKNLGIEWARKQPRRENHVASSRHHRHGLIQAFPTQSTGRATANPSTNCNPVIGSNQATPENRLIRHSVH